MIDISGAAGVAGITTICYLLGLGVRLSAWDNKYIPLLCGLAGGALGALSLAAVPGFPATNYLDAVATGIAAGLAATGADQLHRQLRD